LNYLHDLRDFQRINIALSRGGAMMLARRIDLTRPATWEFSGFSQNGEDGILDVLRHQLTRSNRYFIEIGAADGIENNTAWLVVAEKYAGLMIEGDAKLAKRANRTVVARCPGVECHTIFATPRHAEELKSLALYLDPDVFSIDIDGNDYYVAQSLLNSGFRPKIFVVEYNAVFGPVRPMTIEYEDNFVFTKAHATQLYYGASISGWRKLFDRYGYRFITVDQNGVNAFFVDPSVVDGNFLNGIIGLDFAENSYQQRKFRMTSDRQFALIADRTFVEI